MKKSLFIGILLFIMSIMIVQAKDKTLYGVLKNEANSGGLARKYTGEHQDSFAGTGDKDIYHWYAENDNDGTAILDKNNVIFAGHCWQMIRTTDTGGVKMIYNGEAENNQCLSTRGNHVGYSGGSNKNLTSDYYYGTSYEFDSINKTFSLSGTISHGKWSGTNYEPFIDKYTCLKQSERETCTTIYYVYSYYNSTNGSVLSINSNSHFSQFGSLAFNNARGTRLSGVGYMYNKDYLPSSRYVEFETILNNAPPNTLVKGIWYSSNIAWGTPVSNRYNLVNPNSLKAYTIESAIKGKYTFGSTDSSFTRKDVIYVVDFFNSNNQKYYYYIYLKNGELLEDTNYTFGKSYTDNGDGTYIINNPMVINIKDWYSQYRNIETNRYVCKNTVNNICNDLWYVVNTHDDGFDYIKVKNIKFAKGFTYENGIYKLNDDSITFWNYADSTNQASLNNAHYTCWNETGECEFLYYIYEIRETLDSKVSFNNIKLENGKGIEDILDDVLYGDDVNTNSSVIKIGIDQWYKKYMLNYDNYIEDTIFCNDRTQNNELANRWNPNGGDMSVHISFYKGSDLSCFNDTDKFSINNNKAKLTYKIGLMTKSEMNLLNNINAKKTGVAYYLLTPFSEGNMSVVTKESVTAGTFSSSNGVRPALSLKFGTEYISGDGSMEDPFIVELKEKHNIVVNNDDEKGTIQIDEVNDVEESSDVSFSIDTVLGYQVKSVVIKDADNQSIEYQFSNNRYSFEMPASDVTITVTYEKVKSSINVQIVNETKDLNIEINDLTQVEYQEEVVFKVTPIKGYKLNTIKVIDSNNQEIEVEETNNKNEYSFIMPVGNVTIIPSYEKVSNSVVVEDNSNTKEIIISVNDSTAVVYEELVKVTIVPVEGYELEKLIIVDEEGNSIEYQKTNKENEYSFVMPDTNVSITPVYKEIPKPIVNPKTGSKILPIIIIFFAVIGTSFYAMKKRI